MRDCRAAAKGHRQDALSTSACLTCMVLVTMPALTARLCPLRLSLLHIAVGACIWPEDPPLQSLTHRHACPLHKLSPAALLLVHPLLVMKVQSPGLIKTCPQPKPIFWGEASTIWLHCSDGCAGSVMDSCCRRFDPNFAEIVIPSSNFTSTLSVSRSTTWLNML